MPDADQRSGGYYSDAAVAVPPGLSFRAADLAATYAYVVAFMSDDL